MVNVQMSYLEFRKASYRHLNTCYCLLNNIELEKCNREINQILINIYYLSGYVIECSLKFAFFSAINYNPKKSVYDYMEIDWKHHNLVKLQRIASNEGVRFSQDIPILGSNFKVTKKNIELFNKRNDPHMHIRYQYEDKDLTLDVVRDYIKIIDEINKKIINQFN